jgi:uncharacterized protein YkwD
VLQPKNRGLKRFAMLPRILQFAAPALITLSAAVAGSGLGGAVEAADAAPTATAVASAAPQCHGAYASGAGKRAAHTIVCLINAQRARHGLPRLNPRGDLARAARRHARDMVRRGYFDHRSPGGSSPASRAADAGYHAVTIAENLAFGAGSWGTPAGTVAQWLGSPPHRRALLSPRLRDIGIGVAGGCPTAGYRDVGTTVAATLGRR